MEQAVQHSRGDGGIVVEEARPVFVRLIGGDDGRTFFIAAADDLEEEIGAGFVDGQVSQLIENQPSWSQELLEFAFKPALGLGGAQGVEGLDGGGKEHRVALEAGGMAQSGGQRGFAQADAADKDHAGFVLEEGPPEEVLHLGLIDLFGPAPVELFQSLDDGEASASHTSKYLPLLAALSFAFDETGQVLHGGPLLARRFVGQPLIVLGDEEQLANRGLRRTWVLAWRLPGVCETG